MTSSSLTLTVSYDGRICVIAAADDLDLTTAARFARCTSRALDEGPERLVFDLAGLTFLDCTGARALAAAAQAAPAGCPVIVRSVSPVAARMLMLLGLDLECLPAPTAAAARPGAAQQAGAALDGAHARAQVVNPDPARTQARLIRAAQDLAATEEQIASTFARMAAQCPAQADRLTAVSQSARAFADRTRQWAHSQQAPAGSVSSPQASDPGPAG